MLKNTIKSGDWRGEKHVPVIEYEKKDGMIEVEVSVGKEVPHPNTTEHYIAWIELYFEPDNGKFPILIGHVTFTNHSDPLTEPRAKFYFKTERSGKLMALSYCNLHGLWEGETNLK